MSENRFLQNLTLHENLQPQTNLQLVILCKQLKTVNEKSVPELYKITRLSYYNVTTRLVDLVGLCWFYKNLTEKIC